MREAGYILGRRHKPMAYSENLAGRVAEALRKVKKLETKKMMGGLCFMVDDKMALGILAEDLMVRLDPEVREKALKKKGCREMGFTGRPMKAFVFVGPEGTRTDKELREWVELALEFNPRAKSSRKSR
jgi:TfoX/Sxy family transcriptional regulator of competence genes